MYPADLKYTNSLVRPTSARCTSPALSVAML